MSPKKSPKKPRKSPPPRAAAPSPWKAPPPAFTRPSADDRLLELFHHVTSVRTDVSLLHHRLERTDQHIRTLAVLAEARELLRAVVKLAPAVPPPQGADPAWFAKHGAARLPLELTQAAGELLPQLNELLKEARR